MVNNKTKQNNEKVTLTPYQQELADTARKVLDYKKPAEANVVSILYKNPELFYSYDNLNLNLFNQNEWKVYFSIISEMFLKEKIQKIDEVAVGLYLEKHSKLSEKYSEYGGWSAIVECGTYVKEENFDAYLNELKKWNTILSLTKQGFPIKDKLSDFADMSLNDIYDYYESKFNHTFINADVQVKSYDISDGIYDYIDKLNEGCNIGLPFYNMGILNKTMGGLKLGDMNVIAAISNLGKSSYVRNLILPSILMHKEKIVLILNEEGKDKVQLEMMVWVANNILHKEIKKYQVRDGKFTDEIKSILKEAANWICKYKENRAITIVPLPSFTTSLAIKVIKKYASLGVKYFVLDTFKSDSGVVSQNTWFDLQANATALYDTIKPETGNLSLTLCYQLEKGKATRQRYLNMDNLGISKNIIDCCSEALFIRQLYDDEMPNQKNSLSIYRLEGKEGKTKIPVSLDENKNYHIIFIGKTRNGSKNEQIVVDADFGKNVMSEVGITRVPMDFN